MKTHHYIIGCGGVGSYFLPPFLKTLRWIDNPRFRNAPVTLIDGDRLEEKNLRRQHFDNHPGNYKVNVLHSMFRSDYGVLQMQPCYIDTSFQPEERSLLLVFCDNHPARKDALAAADRTRSTVIIAANSSIGAQAYVYLPEWKGGPLDPRVRFPEIETDTSDSPVHAAGCATEANLEANPQTPIANYMAASHALLLWNFWNFERPKLDREMTLGFWPVELCNTGTTTNTVRYGDIISQP